ncbi:hypothetical protein [Flavivirga sp. 57AJ16]|uniref:hypothetical protein n=1 Tax=Flavivirga sp. 57AJ16 TaxID=3025307 RepID=UPI002365F20F|nr:hypothetical protein [Flavivirga sp. 57AJ16]MDD7887868.1 hypothetical protein [Flavivirga sp. 57AJ16]
MDKIILPALRSHVPGVTEGNGKPTWHIPIHIYTKSGIDFDFGPLLLFDKAVIDGQSLEYIQNSKKPEFAPLKKSITYLKGEGFLETSDFGSDLEGVRSIINSHIKNFLNDPIPLRAPVLRGIEGYRSNIKNIENTFKDYNKGVLSYGFGMHLMIEKSGGRINDKKILQINKLMVSKKARWTKEELELVKEIIRPTVESLYQKLVLSEIYGVPFLDVDYTSEMYSIIQKESLRAVNGKANLSTKKVLEGQNLFNCIIPNLRPSSAEEMIKFLKQPSIKDFRQYIDDAATSGNSITKGQYTNLLTETLRAEQKYKEIMTKIAWGERAISFIPFVNWVAPGISVLLDKYFRKKTIGKHEWLYALIKSSN